MTKNDNEYYSEFIKLFYSYSRYKKEMKARNRPASDINTSSSSDSDNYHSRYNRSRYRYSRHSRNNYIDMYTNMYTNKKKRKYRD